MNENLDDIIKNDLEVDEIGMNKSITFSADEISKFGIKDVNSFVAGMMDGLADADFNESNEDYIKGYKYGKTGKF